MKNQTNQKQIIASALRSIADALDGEPIAATLPRKKMGRRVDPTSRRQQALVMFAKGAQQVDVENALGIPMGSAAVYASQYRHGIRAGDGNPRHRRTRG
jgi:hypothetical protein